MGEFKFYFVKSKQTKPKTKQQKTSHKEKKKRNALKGILNPVPCRNIHLFLPEMTPTELCSGWQQGCPSQMEAAEDLGDQATSLQSWHLVVGGRFFFPSTLKNVANHSSSLWWGTGGWLTLSSSVQIQMLRNNFPPTLASAWTIGQHTICHPEPYTL